MRKPSRFVSNLFAPRPPDELRDAFHAFSLDRTAFAFTILALLDLPFALLNSFMDYRLYRSGAAPATFLTGIITFHVLILLLSAAYLVFILLEKRFPALKKGEKGAVHAYAVIFFAKAPFTAGLSQLFSGSVLLYVIILVVAVVVVMLRPLFVFFLYGISFAAAVVGISLLQSDPALRWSNLINVTVLSIAAPTIWFIYYRFRLQAFINKAELERTRKELAASEERFRSIVELAPEGIVISGLDGRLHYLSPAACTIFGISPETDVIGVSLYRYVDPSMHKKVEGRVEMMVRNKENQMVTDYKLLRQDGTVFDGEIASGPFRQQDGTVTGIISIIRDVSDRKLMERKLQDLNRLKDKIFQIISHDLKRPMVDFKNLLYILEDRRRNDSEREQKKLYLDIRHSLALAELLMENLFALGQKHAESAEPCLEICSFQSLLLDIQAQFEVILGKKKITLHIDREEDVALFADPHMITTVLRNLISNAVKYTMPGGEVALSCSIGTDTALISVSDTGIGMPPEVLESVRNGTIGFTSHGTAGETGTGIGLSVCRYFLEKHETDLSFDSSQGKGTTVAFQLKRYKG